MKLHSSRIDFVLPVFFGALCSLLICIYLTAHTSFFYQSSVLKETEGEIFVTESCQTEFDLQTGLEQQINLARIFTTAAEKTPDFILEKFRDEEYREWVTDFFTEISGSREIAEAILINTDYFDVSPALAFALVWEESRFNPRAVNRANRDESIDRGLFQLNSRSFPNLEMSAFFDINQNARHGVAHLRYSLDATGYEIGALAMYNAGQSRIRNTGTPKVTLHYVHRILENRRRIEANFKALYLIEREARMNEIALQDQSELVFSGRFHLGRTFISASPLW